MGEKTEFSMPRRTSRLPTSLLSVAALFLLLFGCGGDDGITEPEGSSFVTFSFDGLEPMGGGLNYQAWVIYESGNTTVGFPLILFNINGDGQMVHPLNDTILSGPFHADVDAVDALGIAISLEVTNVLVQVSSFTFILSGEVVQGTVNLSAEDFFALDRDFSNAAGEYILATPTDDTPDNELSGIWFMDPVADPIEPGLALPEAPKGWIYEGWIETDDDSLSTGKFVWVNEPDSTSVYSSGLNEAPEYPGEDFVVNEPQHVDFPLDLSGATVFISIEPWNEWDVFMNDPFYLRILEAQVPADATPMTLYPMTSLASQLPSGTATIQ